MSQKKRPLISVMDIRKAATTIPVTTDFIEITRLLFSYEWTSVANAVDYHEFCGDTALTKGLQILLDETPLFPEPIRSLQDHAKYSYDMVIFFDTKGANAHAHLTGRLSFFKFMDGSGIDLTGRHKMDVVIGDDLSARGNELKWIFEGWALNR